MGQKQSRGPSAGESPGIVEESARYAAPAEAPAPAGEGGEEDDPMTRMYVLTEPADRARKISDYYSMPEVEVGRGHYGTVRIASNSITGAKVAVKTIPKRKPIYVEMLKNEIQILEALDHPNIIKLIDKFEEGRFVHLVFELCEGGELFEPIADPHFRFSERQAARIIRNILDSVKYMHDHHIVHRDLKPENVLLKSRGIDSDIRVIDFGLATYFHDGDTLTRHVGTPYYIAPEILDRSYGRECDLWSTGVILFTLLCGLPPFWGDTEREIYRRIRTGRVTFQGPEWEIRSPESKEFVRRLLDRNPGRRLTADEALQNDWVLHEGDCSTDLYNDRTFARIFARIRRYAAFPWLKRLALAVAARSLTRQQTLRELRFFEDYFDRDRDGAISWNDLYAVLEDRRANIPREEVIRLIDALDVNRDGMVTFTEFCAAIMPRVYYLARERVLDVFGTLDLDGDGYISQGDLERIVSECRQEDYADDIMVSGDLDDDDRISFADFLRVLCGGERDAY